MVKKFEEFVNENYEKTDNREVLVNLIRKYLSGRSADILLLKFGLYKGDAGEYLEPLSSEDIGEKFGLGGSRVNEIIKKSIKTLQDVFGEKYDTDGMESPYDERIRKSSGSPWGNIEQLRHSKISWLRNNQIRKKDKELMKDLLSVLNDGDVDGMDDEDLKDLTIKMESEDQSSLFVYT